MATIAVTGTGGVTTTTVAMALGWPRQVTLIEADPTGGSAVLAGYLRGTVLHRTGIRDLAYAARHSTAQVLADAVPAMSVPLDPRAPHVGLVPGVVSANQAQYLDGLWRPLLDALDLVDDHPDLEQRRDALIDLGRPGAVGFAWEVFCEADLSLLVTRTDLPALAKTQAAVQVLTEHLTGAGIGTDHVRLVALGSTPYSSAELSAVFDGLPVIQIPMDPARARVYSHGDSRRHGSWPQPGVKLARLVRREDAYRDRTFAGSGYVQSIHALVGTAVAAVAPDRGPDREFPAPDMGNPLLDLAESTMENIDG